MLRISSLILFALLNRNLFAVDVHFNEHVRPILAEHCLQCHGPDASKRKGDLRLDQRADADRTVVANTAEESELFKRITSQDEELMMPPPETGKKLTAAQIEMLRLWIATGARYEGHWAYEPVRKPNTPLIESDSLTDIDRFIVERLNSRGLKLSPKISKQQWIRRATLDLLGIPPTWDEVQSFVNDHASDAEGKVIDRLLDSPRYGERWGRHWLDIARYADTHGGAAIGFTQFPFSYTYRDYVIRAFNSDLPYDRFVIEQLAADQLGLDENSPSLAALGFLTVGMQFRNKHDVIDDQIDVVARGLQGLTVACARCHDHKYDAIPTENYYSLYATFAASQTPDRLPVIGEPSHDKAFEDYQTQLDSAQAQYDDMSREQLEVMRGRLRMQVGMYLREIVKGTPEQDLSSAFLSYRTDDMRPMVLERWRSYLAKLPDSDPVFGLWLRLARLHETAPDLNDSAKLDFAQRAAEIREALEKENGEPAKPADMKNLGARAPKWNTRVLQTMAAKQPKSLLEVADVYGEVFGTTHQEWLKALQASADEAKPDGTLIPDEDERHVDVNSPMLRQLRRHLYAADTPTAVPDKLASTLLNRTPQDSLNGKKGAIHGLHLSSAGSPPRGMVLQENPNAQNFFIFRRGNPLDRGELVQPHFLTAVSKPDSKPFETGKRRLGLAQAIVSQENPLTRRVIVNWAWQQHFGQGLVRTADDFGIRGRPPTHPHLLDYLAEVFVEDGWSIKRLHRRIMLSAAYAQAAVEDEKSRAIDPENELLWRMPRRRLDLESMRDSMLAASAELDNTMGGRPIDLQATPVVARRSVYGFVNRDIVSSLASTFDGANPNACTAKRPDTTVPQQTLFALNSEFVQDRAVKLAALSESSAANETERIRWMYQRLYARAPEETELLAAQRFVQSESNASSAEKVTSTKWQQLAHVLLAANEFVFVD